ncbi:MAG: DUF4230 domain-containing protein [bacterium]
MRKFLFGVVIAVIILFTYRFCTDKNVSQPSLKESSLLIQEQLKNVGKLVVTEGHFSEVFNYENSKELFGEYITADKKALVVVNAEVQVMYDLSKLVYELDEIKKEVRITHIPEAEVKINPDLEYYDIQSDFFNPFEAADYNTINKQVKEALAKKLENASIVKNAENRLLSELQKIYLLTNVYGWKLSYQETTIDSMQQFEILELKPKF